MIDPREAADSPSPGDPASRLGESLKQYELANQEIGSDVGSLLHQLAIETAWIERHLDAEVEATVKRNGHATVFVSFDDETSVAEASAALAKVADPDKSHSAPSSDGVTVRLIYDARYRDALADREEVSPDAE